MNIGLLTELLDVNGFINDQSQCYAVTFMTCNQRQLLKS